jgi:pyruvate dehydrogenase complex dehydrogenase (E1) component
VELVEKPVVILAKTVKGWTLGGAVEGRNVTHQAKKLAQDELKAFRDRIQLPIPDKDIKEGETVRRERDPVSGYDRFTIMEHKRHLDPHERKRAAQQAAVAERGGAAVAGGSRADLARDACGD